MKKLIVLMTIAVLVLSGCASKDDTQAMEETTKGTDEALKAEYKKITPQEAKTIMDSDENYVILDVRTQSEFDEGHISGAILLPSTEIEKKAKEILKDKDVKILVYCRSGSRSSASSHLLVELGYTQVLDFGGIIDWPYETVK